MGRIGAIAGSVTFAAAGLRPILTPSAFAASRPASTASFRPSEVERKPFAAPAQAVFASPSSPVGAPRSGAGRNIARMSSQRSLPPQWDQRWTTGDQPPDMATQSHLILVSAPPMRPSGVFTPIFIASTALPPSALAMTAPV